MGVDLANEVVDKAKELGDHKSGHNVHIVGRANQGGSRGFNGGPPDKDVVQVGVTGEVRLRCGSQHLAAHLEYFRKGFRTRAKDGWA